MISRICFSLLISVGFVSIAASQPADPDQSTARSASEREIRSGELGGLLLEASDNAPAILIVPGSGPTDRDGNNPMGVVASTYKLLVEDLAQAGVTSLRVDKRGMFSSAAAGDPNQVTQEIYAQDYLDWAETLRAETGQDCVFLLGHSEGGQMVSAAAAQDKTGICGLILVSAPGRPVFDVLRDQLKANPANAPILDQAMKAIDQLEAGENVKVRRLHPALQGLFAPQVQDFMISSYGVDPQSLVKQARLPTLVLQGDRDIQVSLADAERLSQPDNARAVILSQVNHVLKVSPDDPAGNMATYADPDLPLADSVVTAIVDFIAEVQSTNP
ncbi:MAG: alpha/beta fold hydrolase [Pseudomonadota bacterium]